LKQVVGHVLKARVEDICKENTGALPGTSEYLAGYQKALSEVVEELTEEEESEYKALMDEWTSTSPPLELQRK
jgi:hypothetical protein